MDAIKRSGAIKKISLLRVLRSMTTLTTFPNPLPTFLLFLSSGFLSQFSFPFIEREKQILERSIVDVSCFPDWTNLFKLSKLRFNYSFLWILSLSLPFFLYHLPVFHQLSAGKRECNIFETKRSIYSNYLFISRKIFRNDSKVDVKNFPTKLAINFSPSNLDRFDNYISNDK